MKLLQLSVHFQPNVGGVETHLNDLVKALLKRGFGIFVLTYMPLTTKAKANFYEHGDNLTIIRIPWVSGWFYKLVSRPLLEFLYLFPALFFLTPFVLILKGIDVIHAHGLIAGFVGVFWGKLLGKRVVVSTHSIYSFPKKGLYKDFVSWIFNSADYCLGLSNLAADEIKSLGVGDKKVGKFTYWIDLKKFKIISSKLKARKTLEWKDEFIVLFVGRLVGEKGVNELLQSVKDWDKRITLAIIGSGPLESKVKEVSLAFRNVKLLGVVNQDQLPFIYNASDILIVPSTSEEGFGRVILEAFACGLPVIGANRGAIPEAMDKSVGKLIDVTAEEIREAVEYFYNNEDKLNKLAQNCRKFAEEVYSEKNVEKIIEAYQ